MEIALHQIMNVKDILSDVSVNARERSDKIRSTAEDNLFGKDGLNFRDVIDLINPLQHIPIVGRIYRAITNDDIAPGIRVAGGSLFGGPMGAAFAAAGLMIDKAGSVLSDNIAVGKKSMEGDKEKSGSYSIDRVIAERRRPLNIQTSNAISGLSGLTSDSGSGLASSRQWPYSMKQSHMPFIKISQLIEENYRFLENEARIQTFKDKEYERIDRRL